MRRRHWLGVALGAGAALAGGAAGAAPDGAPPRAWRRRALLGFGTTLTLQAGHDDPRRLDAALDAAVRTLRDIERQMSLFDPDSALSRLNRDGRLTDPPADLLAVLRLARDVSAASGGAFDVTVQPLWEAWASAARAGRLPEPKALADARRRVDWRALVVEPGLVRFAQRGMAATLNGIAQGHAADRVRDVLRAHGIRHALVDAGEWAALGRRADGGRWTLGVADPHRPDAWAARLLADGRCVATSADSEAAFSADRRHHHIVDPRTGRSPPGVAAVTVLARRGALADALTKVMFVAGAPRALELARAWDVDVLVVDKAGRRFASPGLPQA